MASKRIITVSIGSQTVSMAEFLNTSNGVTLQAFETRELLADPAADASRVSQATLSFSEMVESMKLKKNVPVYCTLPSLSVFSRPVKLLHVEPGKLAETVAFEAQQNIPYPLAEVVWDYKVVSPPNTEDPEVLIVAAKTDLLEDWTDAAHQSKLNPEAFELAPIAIYNAFLYNYGEPKECCLLIDLGARTTNLFFLEPGKFFFRVISSGGSALTAAVAKEFGENFTAAENRKRASGFVAQGSNFEEHPDPNIARLSKVLRNALTRLHTDIARSISFYRSQQAGAAPTRVYVCGGGSTLPLINNFLTEKLSVPVETFNPFRCVPVAKTFNTSNLAKIAPLFAEHVGLALRATVTCPMAFNLIPLSVRKERIQKQRVIANLFAAACLCAPILAGGWYLNHSADKATELTGPQKAEAEKLNKTDKEIKALQTSIAETIKKVKPLEVVIQDRQYWTSLLNFIHTKLPDQYVWITSLDIAPPPPAPTRTNQNNPHPPDTRVKLSLKGLYLENPDRIAVVERFAKKLHDCPLFDVAPEQEWTRKNVNSPTEWAQEFEIPLYLKNSPNESVNLLLP